MARAKLTSNNKTVGANLTDSNWNELVNFANNNLDDINSLKSADTTLQENIEAAQAAADEAKAIAEGAVQGKAYDDYQSMIDALEAMSAGDLNIGQVIYIGTSGVPDVWVSANDVSGTAYTYTDDATVQTALQSDDGLSGTWYTLRALDGEKVDLTDYYTKTEVDGKISAIQSTSGSQSTDIETLTQGLADEKTARSDADAALQTSVENAQSAAESAQSTADAASSAANANANAIDAEVSARKQADADLQQQIDGAAKTGSAVSLSADSSSVLALKPDDITADTSTSGVPYVGGKVGTQATLAACDYALMSKAITLKKGDTLTVNGKVVSVGGVYIYKIVSGTMAESATVELLIKGNTYTATEDMEASIFALPTEGSESTAASLLSAATYMITTPSLKTLLADERSERIAADDEIRALAKGATSARSYDSYEAMITAVNAMGSSDMQVGTQIYIKATGAQNTWVSAVNSESVSYTYVDDATIESLMEAGTGLTAGYYELMPLSTASVDLTDYYTKDTIDARLSVLTAAVANALSTSNKSITAIRYVNNKLLLFGKDSTDSASVVETEDDKPTVVLLNEVGDSVAIGGYFDATSWAMADSTIATVDSGTITAINEGITTLMVVTTDGQPYTVIVCVIGRTWIGSVDLSDIDTRLTALEKKSVTMVALTQDEYDALVAAGTVDSETYYNILEEE